MIFIGFNSCTYLIVKFYRSWYSPPRLDNVGKFFFFEYPTFCIQVQKYWPFSEWFLRLSWWLMLPQKYSVEFPWLIGCTSDPTGNYLFKVNNGNTRTMCEIWSELTIKTPELRQWRRFVVFFVNFEHISHIVLVFSLLTWKETSFWWLWQILHIVLVFPLLRLNKTSFWCLYC